jgi:curved DNA-binding protein CbpA
MSEAMDHYETLGVRRDATAAEIRRAYRRLARRFHPDVVPSAGADMAAVNEAWRTLGDPGRRAAYDSRTRATSGAERTPGPTHGDFHDAGRGLDDGAPGRSALVVLITAMAVLSIVVLVLVVLIGFADGATPAAPGLR